MKARITPDRIETLPDIDVRSDAGADVVFFGRVRDREGDVPIRALYYEHYAGMAESELIRLAEETTRRFELLDLECVHRVGEVPVGDASIRVRARSRHRAAALEAVDAFIVAMKRDVPIWKWGIREDGSRFPT